MAPKNQKPAGLPAFFSKMSGEMSCAVTAASIVAKGEDSMVPFPDPMLTWVTGGGIALNRLNIYTGMSGTGKTFLCAMAAGLLQKRRPNAWIIILDVEYYYDSRPERVKRLEQFGINLERTFIISSNEPDVIFARLSDLEASLKTGEMEVCALIADSFGALEDPATANKLNEGEVGAAGNKMGGTAKLIKPLVIRLLRIAAEQKVTVLAVQHAMEDIQAAQRSMGKGPKKWIVLGGQALRLMSDVMLISENVERKDALIASGDTSVENEDKDVVAVGKTVRFRGLKSRDTMEGKTAEVKFNFDTCQMVQKEQSLFRLATLLGVIVHPVNADTGVENVRYWCFKDTPEQKWHGADQVAQALNDVRLYDRVFEACMAVKDTPKFEAGTTIELGKEQ
jgi:RecA/RadA recombinase